MRILNNRRQRQRQLLAHKIWYRIQDGPFTRTRSVDISLTGIRLIAKEALLTCDMLLSDARGRFVSFRAQAVWSKLRADGRSYEVGMRLEPVSTSGKEFENWMDGHVFS